MSKIQSYLKSKLEAWIPFEGMPGFEIKLAYLSREELNRIRTAATRITFNPKSKVKEENVDSEIFMKEYIKACILDWKGFTLEYASKLLPIEVPKGVDLEEEIQFSTEEAYDLTKNSPSFDSWLSEAVGDLEHFRQRGNGK
jgi:hypothetical protein